MGSAAIPNFEDFKKQQPDSGVPNFEDFKAQHDAAPTEDTEPGNHGVSEFLTSPHGFLREGAGHLFHGIRQAVSPDPGTSRWSGGTEALHGAESMATPFAMGAAIPAVVGGGIAPALGGAAVGTAAGLVANPLMRAGIAVAGGGPEAQEFGGDLAGDAAGLYGGIKAGRAIHGSGGINTTRPDVAMTRVFRPTPSNSDFPESPILPETMERIKAVTSADNDNSAPYAPGRMRSFMSSLGINLPGGGKKPFTPGIENGQLNLIPAAQKAADVHAQALDPYFDRMEGTTVNHSPIVEATKNAVGSMLPSEQGSPAAQSLVARADMDYRNLGPREMAARKADLNKKLQSYYGKSDAGKSAALTDMPEAVLKAQRDAVAETLYRHLDPENEGAGPREIESRRGDILDFMNDAKRRNNAIVAEQPTTRLGEMMEPLRPFARRIPGAEQILYGKGIGGGLPFVEGAQGRSLPLMRSAFKGIDENAGKNAIGMLPGPGLRLLGPVTDTSGPVPALARDASAVGAENPRARLMLEAPKGKIGVSGVTAPDYAGQIKRGATQMDIGPRQIEAPERPFGSSANGPSIPDIIGASSRGKGGGQYLLPAPESGIPPVRILPRGPAGAEHAVGSSGPVPLTSTETPRPAPGVRGGRLMDILQSFRDRQFPEDPQPLMKKR